MCISTGLGLALGGLFGGGGAILAGSAQSDAMDTATDIQSQYLNWQKQMYYEDLQRRMPFYNISVDALPGLKDYISGNFDITTTPEYKTQSEALDREIAQHLSARGLQESGFGVEENARLKTGLMSNLYNQRFARLASLANLGSMGMAQAPNLSQVYGNLSNLALAQGQSQAQMWQGLGQLPMDMYNSYSLWKYLDTLKQQNLWSNLATQQRAWDLFS